MKLKDLLKEGSDSKTNYFYLNDNYEETLHKIPLDLQFEIQDLLDEKLGNGFFEKTIKKYEDEFSKLAFYHPIHDKWLPKEQAAKVVPISSTENKLPELNVLTKAASCVRQVHGI